VRKATFLTTLAFYDTLTFIREVTDEIRNEHAIMLSSVQIFLKGTSFMTVTMSIALLLLRLGVGLTLAGHGVQKLFGWFGGPGLKRVKQGFEKQGFKPAWPWVVLAIVGEVGGGLSVALGFLTPLGAAGIFGAMAMATFKSHWKNGFWLNKGGYEYSLILMIASITIGLMGPGNYSLDTLFGIHLPQSLLFCVLAVAALLVDAIGILSSRKLSITTHENVSKVSEQRN
jgi:putative oxidoreductase